MVECENCVLIESGEKIFEDDKAVVVLSPKPASRGHVLIMPKEHFTILEQMPDFLAGHLFRIANTVSTTIFEVLRVHGTNIMIENGIAAGQKIAHFAINVIPRSENDGLGFNWQPTTVDEEDMSTVELQLKEETKNMGGFEKEKKEPMKIDDTEKQEVISGKEEDYMLRQLKRLP